MGDGRGMREEGGAPRPFSARARLSPGDRRHVRSWCVFAWSMRGLRTRHARPSVSCAKHSVFFSFGYGGGRAPPLSVPSSTTRESSRERAHACSTGVPAHTTCWAKSTASFTPRTHKKERVFNHAGRPPPPRRPARRHRRRRCARLHNPRRPAARPRACQAGPHPPPCARGRPGVG